MATCAHGPRAGRGAHLVCGDSRGPSQLHVSRTRVLSARATGAWNIWGNVIEYGWSCFQKFFKRQARSLVTLITVVSDDAHTLDPKG